MFLKQTEPTLRRWKKKVIDNKDPEFMSANIKHKSRELNIKKLMQRTLQRRREKEKKKKVNEIIFGNARETY